MLTVYDEAGNIGTATKRITVLDSDNLSTELTVTTSSNVPIKGVMVYYELDDGSKSTIYTNKNGKAVLKSSEGALTVYLYKNGYAPQKQTLTIGKNSLNHNIKLLILNTI
ncbi:MAG: carboxypeptidase regulatory-like domain-containing protein [Oscillospiraceae bacterium]